MQSPHDLAAPAEDERTVRLPANGTTIAAEELRSRLSLVADLGGETVVDASAAENVGQAVLQVLIAARTEAARCTQDFSIINPSPAFTERVTQCRLAEAIGLTPDSGENL